ncbi:MAG: priA, partial [Bacillales bacterium]|nr:priA [Bacillales bacterium]
MNIASVIVDVPARQTDKSFDYLIPDQYKGNILPGMRIIVPFGPRKIQGFVIGLKDVSDFSKLKEISEPMDLYPVLTKELLALGDWLAEKTLCYKISGFQAMLPAALKAKYEKKLILAENVDLNQLSVSLRPFFEESREVTWDDALKNGILSSIQKEAANKQIDVIYEVKERVKRKKLKHIIPQLSIEELKGEKEKISARAGKQKDIIDFFINRYEPIELRTLLSELKISSQTVSPLIDKKILLERELEVYRDPYQDRQFQQTYPLP